MELQAEPVRKLQEDQARELQEDSARELQEDPARELQELPKQGTEIDDNRTRECPEEAGEIKEEAPGGDEQIKAFTKKLPPALPKCRHQDWSPGNLSTSAHLGLEPH